MQAFMGRTGFQVKRTQLLRRGPDSPRTETLGRCPHGYRMKSRETHRQVFLIPVTDKTSWAVQRTLFFAESGQGSRRAALPLHMPGATPHCRAGRQAHSPPARPSETLAVLPREGWARTELCGAYEPSNKGLRWKV